MVLLFLEPIISTCDSIIANFIKTSIVNFKEELEFYIQENEDPVVLYYSNERTLASMYVNGLIRGDKEKAATVLQEYSTTRQDLGGHMRPDIFIRYKRKAIWIECKMDKTFLIQNDHWDVKNWLEWDYNTVFSQGMSYYNAEGKLLNSSYDSGHYVMTLIFKLIKEEPDRYIQKGKTALLNKIEDECDRPWFYSSLFIPNNENETTSIGLEVYGTIKHMNPLNSF